MLELKKLNSFSLIFNKGILSHSSKEWLRLDAPNVTYVIKATMAIILAMSLSMMLGFSTPQTSVLTAFLVMQPHSGMVFSKSFYRFVGTVLGAIIAIILVGALSQDRFWFITLLTIWIGICAAAGFKFRNFMAYGFFLAGYTVLIVAFPVLHHPTEVFNFAISRVSEVLIGLVSASIISEVVFPRKLSNTLFANEQKRYQSIVSSIALIGDIFEKDCEHHDHSNYPKTILESDSLLINSAFESNVNKKDKMYYQRLNSEFMHLSTTYFSLKSIVASLKEKDKFTDAMAHSLRGIFEPIEDLLENHSKDLIDKKSIEELALKLKSLREEVKNNLHEQKEKIIIEDFDLSHDFSSVTFLLARLLSEFNMYINTYLSFLKRDKKAKDYDKFSQTLKFSTYNDNGLLFLAILRGVSVLLLSLSFWILTGWEFAIFTIINAVAMSLLLSSAANPLGFAINFAKGAICSFFVVMLYNFYIIPTFASDIVSYCVVFTPFVALMAWLTTKNIGGPFFSMGFMLMSVLAVSMNSYLPRDFNYFIGTEIGSLIGIVFTILSFTIIGSWSNAWTQRRVSKVLCKQLASLVNDKLSLQRIHLESTGFDLIQRFSTMGKLNQTSSSKLFLLLLSTLEIGRALINIRNNITFFVHKPPMVYKFIFAVGRYFESSSNNDKIILLQKVETLYKELEKNKMFKSAVEQRAISSILVDASLIYTIMKNKISLPNKGEEESWD